eukprot:509257-Pyramimonas_sp.AAC.1
MCLSSCPSGAVAVNALPCARRASCLPSGAARPLRLLFPFAREWQQVQVRLQGAATADDLAECWGAVL